MSEFTYPNSVLRPNLTKANEWYNWGVKNVSGLRLSKNYASSKSKITGDWETTAIGHMRALEYREKQGYTGGARWEFNTQMDDLLYMRKMLKAWEDYQSSMTKTIVQPIIQPVTPNISDYTFEKLIKYNSMNPTQLIKKLEIEIKALELEIQYRLNFRDKANSFTRPIIPRGTKMHFSHPKVIYEKYMDSYDSQTRSKQNQLTDLKDEKQRVLLNQSLRGIDHITSVKFTPFVFIPNIINSSWYTAKTILNTETGKLNSHISKWRNNEMLKKEKIQEKVTIVQDKIIPIEKVTIVENQNITFNEQTNSGDYNITPSTEILIPEIIPVKKEEIQKIIKPDTALLGLVPLGIIGLLLYTRSVKK